MKGTGIGSGSGGWGGGYSFGVVAGACTVRRRGVRGERDWHVLLAGGGLLDVETSAASAPPLPPPVFPCLHPNRRHPARGLVHGVTVTLVNTRSLCKALLRQSNAHVRSSVKRVTSYHMDHHPSQLLRILGPDRRHPSQLLTILGPASCRGPRCTSDPQMARQCPPKGEPGCSCSQDL